MEISNTPYYAARDKLLELSPGANPEFFTFGWGSCRPEISSVELKPVVGSGLAGAILQTEVAKASGVHHPVWIGSFSSLLWNCTPDMTRINLDYEKLMVSKPAAASRTLWAKELSVEDYNAREFWLEAARLAAMNYSVDSKLANIFIAAMCCELAGTENPYLSYLNIELPPRPIE